MDDKTNITIELSDELIEILRALAAGQSRTFNDVLVEYLEAGLRELSTQEGDEPS